jgi:hypothetical protein
MGSIGREVSRVERMQDNMSQVKIEIGGGTLPKGEGFINLDGQSCADIVIDLEEGKLPFESDSVDSVYSSHCLEHVKNAIGLMVDVLRVCKIGSSVEIRLPHWLHPNAMVHGVPELGGHVHVISDRAIRTWCQESRSIWKSTGKRFRLDNIHYQIDEAYHELRPLFPALTDQQVAKYIPNCCHEIHCFMTVVEYEEYQKNDPANI